MGFWKTILGIARNRLIGPPVVVLGLGVAALVFVLTPVTYVSSSLLVLTTPSAGGLEDPNRPGWTTNPLLQFNDGLKTTAAILIQAAGTDQALGRMGAGKGSPAKVVINDGTSNGKVMTASQTGPFIFVQVTSTREGSVEGIVRNAEQYLRDDLVNRQRTLGAPKQTYLMLTEVVPASAPTAQMTKKWEFSGAAFGFIVCAGFGVAYLGARRRTLREAAAETPYDFYYGSVRDAAPLRPAVLLPARPAPSPRPYDASIWENEPEAAPRNGTPPQNGHKPKDYGLPLDADPTETVHDHPTPTTSEPDRNPRTNPTPGSDHNPREAHPARGETNSRSNHAPRAEHAERDDLGPRRDHTPQHENGLHGTHTPRDEHSARGERDARGEKGARASTVRGAKTVPAATRVRGASPAHAARRRRGASAAREVRTACTASTARRARWVRALGSRGRGARAGGRGRRRSRSSGWTPRRHASARRARRPRTRPLPG